MKERKRWLKKYYRSIKSWLPGSRKQNKLILAAIQEEVSAYLMENPEASTDEIWQRFGSPRQIAAASVDEMGMEELLNHLRTRKKAINAVRNVCLCVVAVIVLLVILSIPRVDQIESVPVSSMENIPTLMQAYDDFCYEHRYLTVETEETIQVITVRNIWGSWERYILPCFGVQAQTVPRYGNADYHSVMVMLSPWETENIFTRWMTLSMDMSATMDPGPYAIFSQSIEVIPGGVGNLDGTVCIYDRNCEKMPGVAIFYLVGTSEAAENVADPIETQAVFCWNYTLKVRGVQVAAGEFTIKQPVTVNA